MNITTNDKRPSPDWIEQALQAHLAARRHLPEPTPEFRARCRAAAHSAVDLLKMQQQRVRIGNPPGSLREYVDALARAAGVKLEAALIALQTAPAAAGAASVLGIVQIAEHLGMACDEVLLRLRWGIAQTAGVVPHGAWRAFDAPVRNRSAGGAGERSPESVLMECERGYSPAQQEALREALHAVETVYGLIKT